LPSEPEMISAGDVLKTEDQSKTNKVASEVLKVKTKPEAKKPPQIKRDPKAEKE